MEDFVNTIQDEMNGFDRDYLRKIQSEMFKCSANCCDNSALTQNDLQRCLEKCSRPPQNADNYIKQQMQDLEDRFKRCAMQCGDKIKDKAAGSDDQSAAMQNKYRSEMEDCVNKCGQDMIKLIPSFSKRMRDWFNKGSYLN